ncbi:predicted protein [Scheffersomyces stipitis CBS 6054]|uniref:Uncharacterized protein n=1 Tax=Scheffersomyces stipitis (strain ATCC 58785 / CBS 6054 / NBRC 10063 / NRRL Y-11545) TaxID=322104 RepID=A3LPC3_PICST|nr:predicted protein [Scheffersomyces stipitis CBS 6054]ABN65017.2 predicted protein [Scheffersomyces stipitis CBS 6054]KAG2736121.1 hypothetical protein G9P44_000211 [Scheffersomyces stipitis]
MNSTDYEKLNLSKQELKYVYSQIASKTTSKLDLHLPTSNNDPLKIKVASVLEEFLLGAFDMAKSGFVVDGNDMGTSKTAMSDILSLKARETVEPFDLETNARLRDILLKVEQETIEVTTLRRELPARAKQMYLELVSNTDKEVSAILEDLEKAAHTEEEASTAELERILPHIDEFVKDYESHIHILNELKRAIPSRKAELDSLTETIDFLEKAYSQQQKELI